MSNVNILDKNTGDQHTAAEFNLIKNFINAPIVALGILNPATMVFEANGYYSNYTQAGAVTFNVTASVIDGISQVIYFISDGTNTISFNTSKFHLAGGLYGITDGGTLAAGLWKLYMFSENGKINVNVPASAAADITPPSFSSAEIGTTGNDKLVITMSEALDATSIPATTDFSHAGITGNPAITGVAISGTGVTLTLASDAQSTDIITVSYAKGANPLQDTEGNESANFSGETVTNNITSYPSFVNTHSMIVDASAEGVKFIDTILDFTDGAGTDESFSFELWYKAALASGARLPLHCEDDTERSYFIGIATDGGVYIQLWTDASNILIKGSSDLPYNDTNWHQIIITCDGSETWAGIKIYVDGSELSYGPDNSVGTYTGLRAAGANFKLDIPRNTVAGQGDGKFNLFRVYRNNVLTSGEITTLYNSGVPIAEPDPVGNNLILEHRFNNTTDSDYGLAATAVGSPTFDTDLPT